MKTTINFLNSLAYFLCCVVLLTIVGLFATVFVIVTTPYFCVQDAVTLFNHNQNLKGNK